MLPPSRTRRALIEQGPGQPSRAEKQTLERWVTSGEESGSRRPAYIPASLPWQVATPGVAMRLGTRFTLAFAGIGALVFGGHAWLSIAKESDDLRATALAEVALLGQSLRVATENALRDGQLADLTETIAQLDISDLSTDLGVWKPDGTLMVASPGQPDLAELPEMAKTAIAQGLDQSRFVDRSSGDYLVRAVPLKGDDGAVLGALTLCRPTSVLARDLDETRNAAIVTAMAFIALAIVLGLVLGHAWVARPLVRVVRAIRRVRDGDLDEPPPTDRDKSEIAEISRELSAMREELRATRAELSEREARQRDIEARLRDTDRMVAIGQLASGLAHEIGSPLQVLQGRAAALLDATQPDRIKKHARVIVQETARVASIVQDLMRFVRRAPKPKPMHLEHAARAVVDLLDHQAERSGVRLTLEARPSPEIVADEERVLQVILNLVRNALQATSRGGRIQVRVEPDASGGVALEVADDGRGMDEVTRARIFEPFFTTRAAQGGTGLGLSVVRSIADEHAAAIAVDSATGRGTRFRIVFPLALPSIALEASS
ncbi:MAG: HAMP domain-containing sensor histidine kinase [Myxococcota bacterium]